MVMFNPRLASGDVGVGLSVRPRRAANHAPAGGRAR